MVALQDTQPVPRRPQTARRELYREQCQDEDGNRFVVIIWQNKPGLSTEPLRVSRRPFRLSHAAMAGLSSMA